MLSGFGFEEFFGRNSTFEDAESRSAFKETLVHMFPLHNDQEWFVFSPVQPRRGARAVATSALFLRAGAPPATPPPAIGDATPEDARVEPCDAR